MPTLRPVPASTFVFTTHGAPGDLLPYVAIGQRLAARGHLVRIATANHYRAVVEAHGLQFWPLEPDLPPPTDWGALMHPATGTEWLLRHHLCPALPQTVRQLQQAVQDAQVLVTHTTSLAGPVVAELGNARGLRWASGVVSPLALFSRADPPAIPIAPWAANSPSFSRLLLGLLERQFGAFLQPVGALRRELGLPPGTNPLFSDAHSPQLVLGLFSTALVAPQPDWPSAMRIVGFCHGTSQQGLSSETAQFLAQDGRILVFSGASFMDPARTAALQRLVLEMVDKGYRCLLLGMDEKEAIQEMQGRLPGPQCHLSRFEPLDQVLAHSALYLHQGGIGATAAGLRTGVPMALFPASHDQPDTARMAQRRNLAVNLGPKVPEASRLEEAIQFLAGNEAAIAARAAARRQLENEDGAATAAGLLEALV